MATKPKTTGYVTPTDTGSGYIEYKGNPFGKDVIIPADPTAPLTPEQEADLKRMGQMAGIDFVGGRTVYQEAVQAAAEKAAEKKAATKTFWTIPGTLAANEQPGSGGGWKLIVLVVVGYCVYKFALR